MREPHDCESLRVDKRDVFRMYHEVDSTAGKHDFGMILSFHRGNDLTGICEEIQYEVKYARDCVPDCVLELNAMSFDGFVRYIADRRLECIGHIMVAPMYHAAASYIIHRTPHRYFRKVAVSEIKA